MNTLVLLTLTAVASAAADGRFFHGPQAVLRVLPSGHLAETPEVAAARAAHEAEHARARGAFGFPTVGPIATPQFGPIAQFGNTPQVGPLVGPLVGPIGTPFHYRTQLYRGPLANLRVLPSGFLEETPEVVAAKNAHLAEHARAGGVTTFQAPVVLQNFLPETPEVAYARAAHLAEHARAAYNAYYNIHPEQQRLF